MNWKELKKQISELTSDFADEGIFILGLDIGNSTSTISYWNIGTQQPQLIDVSGGYGSSSMPTVVQYIPENDEWVFGEYALLNKGYFKDCTFDDILEKMGKHETVKIEGKTISMTDIMGKYIKALLESCANINPNADIGGVVVAVPTYMDDLAKSELLEAIRFAGIDEEFIEFVPDRECALQYYYFKEDTELNEKLVILDYGSREIRGGLYETKKTKIKALSSIINEDLGTENVENEVEKLLMRYYCTQKEIELEDVDDAVLSQLEAFAYQNRHTLFQSNERGIKLYYNFAFPAFQKNISAQEIKDFVVPFEQALAEFLDKIYTNTIKDSINKLEISKVICLGGGFEMKWARNMVEKNFPDAEVVTMKGSKAITSQGACIAAASKLGIIKQREYNIEDYNVVNNDVGVMALWNKTEQFIPIIPKGSFWWQKQSDKVFILSAEKNELPHIEVYVKNEDGKESKALSIELDGLPERPPKTTRLRINMAFKKYNILNICIKDCGFGELFKASSYEKNIELKL